MRTVSKELELEATAACVRAMDLLVREYGESVTKTMAAVAIGQLHSIYGEAMTEDIVSNIINALRRRQ